MGRSSLGTELARIVQDQKQLPWPAVVLIGLVALAAAAPPSIWLLTRHFNTMAHEGTHATVHSALGHRVSGVRLKLNGTGGTSYEGATSASSLLLGYLGPSLFGLAAAELIRVHHIIAVLWLTMVLLLCLLVVSRNIFTISAVLICGAGLYLVAAYTSIGTQVITAYLIAWFLLLSAIRKIKERGADAADAKLLRDRTKVPERYWSQFWFIGSVIALLIGTALLV